jgi:hypothetical protein
MGAKMASLRGSLTLPALCAGAFFFLAGGYAAAADLAPAPAPAPPPSWWSTITINGEIDAGIMGNPQDPESGLNWGRLFDSQSNEPVFNQGLITIQRPIDSSKPVYDFGFMFQGMFGTDARFTHSLGLCEYCINSMYQVDAVDAYVQAHTPWIFDGGIDFKAGIWPTLEGAEVIESDLNLFYSHSYIFNYAEPYKDLGILAISHVNSTIDIYTAITSGSNTTLGPYVGDNNDAPAFEGGIGLNKLFGGAVTVLATTHIGPESPFQNQNGMPIVYPPPPGCGYACGNDALAFENDIVVTWTVNNSLTLTGDGNYTRFDSTGFDAYGVAGYASYQTPLSWLKINGRAEVYRDDAGEFVGAYPGYFDFVNVEHGYASSAIFQGLPTTYLELTAGLNITPTIPSSIPLVKGLIIRPEVRFDSSLNGTSPFGLVNTGYDPSTMTGTGFGTQSNMVTIGGDIILKF